jgi:glucosyl-dolichyl phosphate glucuronosyltransferase
MSGSPVSMSILLPTHNRVKLLLQILQSLAEISVPTGLDVELIICANACTDNTIELIGPDLKKLLFSTRCIEEPVPGLSIARNRLLTEARGELLAFLDDDVWVSRGWIGAMLDVFNHYPADMVTSKVDLWWEAVQKPRWLSRRSADMLSCLDHGEKVCELFSAGEALSNMAFRRSVLKSVPGFRTDLGRTKRQMVAGDDTDFIARAMCAGHRMFYAPQALLLHWVAPERITRAYLGRAAAGVGTAKILMLPEITAGMRFRLNLENRIKLMLYNVLELLSKAIGYQKGQINQHIRGMMCRGVLDALRQSPGVNRQTPVVAPSAGERQ